MTRVVPGTGARIGCRGRDGARDWVSAWPPAGGADGSRWPGPAGPARSAGAGGTA